jgi:DNA-binding response OmpR family regulator
MRILLVEDDVAMGGVTVRALQSQGWAVDWTKEGETVAEFVRGAIYDLIILDIGLSGIDGFETLRRLRHQGNETPVLMLTARDALDDRVRGLGTGADDYLTKPFALAELIARALALTRRQNSRKHNEIRSGQLRMDLTAKRAYIGEAPVDLSAREWAVLSYLLSQTGLVVSKEQILEAVSGWGGTLSPNAIEVYVSRLRPKICSAGIAIRAIRGFGYLIEESAARDQKP